MKKTVTKSVPGYKWVLEPLCPVCVAAIEHPEIDNPAEIPPLPPLDEGTRVIPASRSVSADSQAVPGEAGIR